MTNPYEIYVISNADLFREGLNAVAAFCGNADFKTVTYIGALIGIVMTAIAYLKQHDVMVFLKWLVAYFFVMTVLLGVTVPISIYNSSDSADTAKKVDGVPIGIALPAHYITAIAYFFGRDLETAFHQADAFQYNQTGMLFGSNLFRLSLSSQLDNADTMNEMNAYVRSCVVGDILINHKYSFNKLAHSHDVWGLISAKPSPIRGIFINGVFNTCVQATTDLGTKLDNDADNEAPINLAHHIPSKNRYAAESVNTFLMQSYHGLEGLSLTANQILKQNLAINAFRRGIVNYATETGSVAGMENFANTTAMMNTRMAWATSAHIGIQTLPLMQVVLLLLMLCLFPLIAVLTMVPGLGFNVFKNYVYTLIWLESWPIMFTVLNLAMTFYARHDAVTHVTLSNINRLAQEQSDIAGIAGYLVLAIPFLSIGLVKGMASTFNQAAQYIGGMIHNIAQHGGGAVAMGNYSLGNVSTQNATANTLNANKHDTNYSDMHGMATNQIANGATQTTTPSGQVITNVSGAMSQLPIHLNASQALSASLTKSAEHYKAAAQTQQQNVDHSISSATTNAMAYDTSVNKGESLNDTAMQGQNAQVDQSMGNMKTIAHEVGTRENISDSAAYKKLAQEAITESIGLNSSHSLIGGLLKTTFGISGSAGSNSRQEGNSTQDKTYQNETSHGLSDREVSEFRKNMHVVENYSQSHAASDQQNKNAALAVKMGADFRKAESAMKSQRDDLTKGERLSQQAAFVSSHSESIQSNFTQAFADYVRRVDPAHANQLLTNTTSMSIAKQRETLAEQFMGQYAKNVENRFVNDASGVNPEQHYEATSQKQSNQGLKQGYESNAQSVKAESASHVGPFDEGRAEQIKARVNQTNATLNKSVDHAGQKTHQTIQQAEKQDKEQIGAGKKSTEKGLWAHWLGKSD